MSKRARKILSGVRDRKHKLRYLSAVARSPATLRPPLSFSWFWVAVVLAGVFLVRAAPLGYPLQMINQALTLAGTNFGGWFSNV